MNIIEITSLNHPGAEIYSSLTEAQLRSRVDESKGIFIAESPKVIKVALDAGYTPISLLCERRHITGDAAEIISRCGDMDVLTGSRDTLANLTGYKLTRGVLCAMRRRQLPTLGEIVSSGASRIAVIDGVVDTTNIGAIFRSAAALGIDGVALTPTCCDPLNRRAIRVSMGSVFLIPWTWIPHPIESLRAEGFATAALALRNDNIPIDSPVLSSEPRLGIIMGAEGDGLSPEVIAQADYVVKIPMSHHVDSLNVAAASAIAFWELRRR